MAGSPYMSESSRCLDAAASDAMLGERRAAQPDDLSSDIRMASRPEATSAPERGMTFGCRLPSDRCPQTRSRGCESGTRRDEIEQCFEPLERDDRVAANLLDCGVRALPRAMRWLTAAGTASRMFRSCAARTASPGTASSARSNPSNLAKSWQNRPSAVVGSPSPDAAISHRPSPVSCRARARL